MSVKKILQWGSILFPLPVFISLHLLISNCVSHQGILKQDYTLPRRRRSFAPRHSFQYIEPIITSPMTASPNSESDETAIGSVTIILIKTLNHIFVGIFKCSKTYLGYHLQVTRLHRCLFPSKHFAEQIFPLLTDYPVYLK